VGKNKNKRTVVVKGVGEVGVWGKPKNLWWYLWDEVTNRGDIKHSILI